VTADSRVLLVRHGETAWNRAGRIQGWAPTSLTDRGRAQARRLGAALAAAYDIDRLLASDLSRTRETTAQLVTGGIDVEPTFDTDWRERHMGRYQGFTRAQLHDRFPSFAIENGAVALEETPDGGETFGQLYDRIDTAWSEVTAAADGDTVLVVTHGGPITIVLAILKELDLVTAVQQHTIPNCSLTAVQPATGEILREAVQPFESPEHE
jgi:probable phosphoglycerate mutase